MGKYRRTIKLRTRLLINGKRVRICNIYNRTSREYTEIERSLRSCGLG